MSGNIPQAFIDELISRVDVVELIDGYIPLKKAGSNYTCCCPFHQEKTASFNVIPHKQFFYCFGCGISGNAIKFLMQFLQISFPDAVKNLAAHLGLSLPENTVFQETDIHAKLYRLLEQIKDYYRQNLYQKPNEIIEYLKKRKLNKIVIDEFQLGYAPSNWQNLLDAFPQKTPLLLETGMIIAKEKSRQYYDRFRHRLMFPLHNRQGKLIGFAGRVIDASQKPKYMNSPETQLFHKQKELYGLYQVLSHQKSPEFILVVEGYLDVISLFQFGLPCAVATMGTATSVHHLQTLNKYTNQIIFCFDGDKAGKQAAWRALENALPFYNQLPHLAFLFLPDNQDPDSYIREYGVEAFKNLIKQSQPLHQYFAYHIYLQHKKHGAQKIVSQLQKHLEKLEDGPGKEMIIQEMARLTRLEAYRIAQWIKKPDSLKPNMPKQQRTPIRLALALMIQHPQSLQKVPNSLLNDVTQRYPEPLGAVIQTLIENPTLMTANLVEHFQNTAFYEVVNQLAVFEHQIQEEQYIGTLIQIFEFLVKQSLNDEIEELILKLKQEGLDDKEKKRLQTLLQNRQVQKT